MDRNLRENTERPNGQSRKAILNENINCKASFSDIIINSIILY